MIRNSKLGRRESLGLATESGSCPAVIVGHGGGDAAIGSRLTLPSRPASKPTGRRSIRACNLRVQEMA